MPYKLPREERAIASLGRTPHDDLAPVGFDAVVVNGVDQGAQHRARLRAMTTASQQKEQEKARAHRRHQVEVMAAEAARQYERPRGARMALRLRSPRPD